jgi:hypothetical protein
MSFLWLHEQEVSTFLCGEATIGIKSDLPSFFRSREIWFLAII